MINVIKTPTLIVGAGPAGLAVAGRMRAMNLPFQIIEKQDKVAWTWHNHYDRLHLHTVNPLSHLPHLPFPDDYPMYVPRAKFAAYCVQYAKHFELNPYFEEEAQSVTKGTDQWVVTTSKWRKFLAENVIIATGVNRVVNRPKWKGEENFRGKIVHSRDYKNPKPYVGQKVLVIGMGNTGAELAYDLSEHGIETYISVRSPVNVVPRDVNGEPVQLTAKKLAKLPTSLREWLGKQIRNRIIGDLSPYGIPMAKMDPSKQLLTTGKTPVIDIGTVKHLKERRIRGLPDVDYFYENGVAFKNGVKHDFDSVILCTGYKAKVEDFVTNTNNLFDKYGVPKQPIGEGAQENLYFVGFDNYKLGGIIGTINTDSETIVNAIKQKSVSSAV